MVPGMGSRWFQGLQVVDSPAVDLQAAGLQAAGLDLLDRQPLASQTDHWPEQAAYSQVKTDFAAAAELEAGDYSAGPAMAD